MLCPSCNESLIVLEFQGIEIDYCVGCEGVWLDQGELSYLLHDKDQAPTMKEQLTEKVGEKNRRCPMCSIRMKKVLWHASANHEICIEECPRNHGLWFDKNELAHVLSDGGQGEADAVPAFLQELFKKKA